MALERTMEDRAEVKEEEKGEVVVVIPGVEVVMEVIENGGESGNGAAVREALGLILVGVPDLVAEGKEEEPAETGRGTTITAAAAAEEEVVLGTVITLREERGGGGEESGGEKEGNGSGEGGVSGLGGGWRRRFFCTCISVSFVSAEGGCAFKFEGAAAAAGDGDKEEEGGGGGENETV